jgi:hypothetical protein
MVASKQTRSDHEGTAGSASAGNGTSDGPWWRSGSRVQVSHQTLTSAIRPAGQKNRIVLLSMTRADYRSGPE